MSFCISELGSVFDSYIGAGSTKYLWLYFGITFAIAILSFLQNYFFTYFCLSAAKKLHDKMLGSILRTKMAFFDTTP